MNPSERREYTDMAVNQDGNSSDKKSFQETVNRITTFQSSLTAMPDHIPFIVDCHHHLKVDPPHQLKIDPPWFKLDL